ncbi:hypothetical protein [Dyadobacter luticola]|uniref:DoxX family protein n=1 Tax=Dyadobacter luticola TaxID=1979387 RepID=A0A5R9L1N9_9BACT|nr:hypothetical protein [Dyadobacter luticola]TLV02443.1 hypothetical protein FEN17_02070 [Dyadobacter luticola]
METYGISPLAFWAAYSTSNLIAITLIWSAKKYPVFTRAAFFVIFIAAAAANTYIAIDSPWAYQDYADTAVPLYKQFILGAFEAIITPMILIIALAQLTIAAAMLFKGKFLNAGCWAGIVFGISIAPLGLYAAFPATILMAVALFVLQRNQSPLPAKKKPSKLVRIATHALK